MKKFMTIIMAAVMCAAALTACGNENASAGSAASVESTQGTESTAGAESTAGTEATGTEDSQGSEAEMTGGRLVVGTNAEFPPFEYVGEDGEPDGFDIALIKAIAEKMGMDIEVQNMEFASLVASIGTKIDAAIAGMTVTDERQAMVDFSDNYYEAVQYVIVPKGSDIAAAADLENKTIGVQLETTGNYIADEIAGATVSAYNRALDAVNDLINGRVDLVIVDKNPALTFAEQYPDQIEALDGAQFEFEPEYYAIALPKGSDMVQKVNDALAQLKEDGTFDALVAEYIQ